MKEKVLYLVRHGEPAFENGVRVCMGREIDPPLSAAGREQAEALCGKLVLPRPEAVFCSPARRAVETAEPVARTVGGAVVREELCEMDSGEWTGLTMDEVHRRWPAFFARGAEAKAPEAPPGGESDGEALIRISRFLDSVAESPYRAVAAVTHYGICRLMIAEVIGLPLERKREVRMEYGQARMLTLTDGRWTVERRRGFFEHLLIGKED